MDKCGPLILRLKDIGSIRPSSNDLTSPSVLSAALTGLLSLLGLKTALSTSKTDTAFYDMRPVLSTPFKFTVIAKK